MGSSKGITVSKKMFALLVIILALIVLFAVYVLLTDFFVNFVTGNINSEIKICETFEKNPLFGSMLGCPS